MKTKLYALALIALASSACAKWKRDTDPKDPIETTVEHVAAKAALYVEHETEAVDEHGFYHGKCDSLLMTTLRAVATNRPMRIVIIKAMGERGRWYRHALHDCYPSGGSASDISNDMLLGLALYAWHFRDLEIVQGVIDWGKAHKWNMGDGDPFRTIMRPTLIATYYDIARELGADPGPTPTQVDFTGDISRDSYCGWTGHEDDVCDQASLTATIPSGFEAHLATIHGLLRALVLGGASEADLADFKAQAERQPHNGLFLATHHLYLDGDQTLAVAEMADDRFFPATGLPTESQRCEEYLYQRDYDADDPEGDWAPCAKGAKAHSGTDLLLALAVSENRLRKRGQ